MTSRWLAGLLGLIMAACASGSPSAHGPGPAAALGEPIVFSFGTLDGRELSDDTTRGRTSALLFVTTFDLPSQAAARLLSESARHHKPRVNAAIVVVEAPRNAPLAQVWREALELELPIAMANPELLTGGGPFGDVSIVPTLVVLTRTGRQSLRHTGLLAHAALESALTQADQL